MGYPVSTRAKNILSTRAYRIIHILRAFVFVLALHLMSEASLDLYNNLPKRPWRGTLMNEFWKEFRSQQFSFTFHKSTRIWRFCFGKDGNATGRALNSVHVLYK